MGEHTSTLARHGSHVGQSGRFWIEACHGGKCAGRSRSNRRRIPANRDFGIATSASWNVTQQPCRTTFAPILTSLFCRVVRDQCSTDWGKPEFVGSYRDCRPAHGAGAGPRCGEICDRTGASNRVTSLPAQASKALAQTIRRMDKARRRATLVAFASQAETMASDDALDIFDAFMTDIASRAKAEGEKKRLVTLQALDIAAMRLVQACGPLLDETVPDVKARQAAFRFMTRF